jgi:hypothetical protein
MDHCCQLGALRHDALANSPALLVLSWWLRGSLQTGQVIPLFYRDRGPGAILRLILRQKDIFGSK